MIQKELNMTPDEIRGGGKLDPALEVHTPLWIYPLVVLFWPVILPIGILYCLVRRTQ